MHNAVNLEYSLPWRVESKTSDATEAIIFFLEEVVGGDAHPKFSLHKIRSIEVFSIQIVDNYFKLFTSDVLAYSLLILLAILFFLGKEGCTSIPLSG